MLKVTFVFLLLEEPSVNNSSYYYYWETPAIRFGFIVGLI